jgi:hypothetical protein
VFGQGGIGLSDAAKAGCSSKADTRSLARAPVTVKSLSDVALGARLANFRNTSAAKFCCPDSGSTGKRTYSTACAAYGRPSGHIDGRSIGPLQPVNRTCVVHQLPSWEKLVLPLDRLPGLNQLPRQSTAPTPKSKRTLISTASRMSAQDLSRGTGCRAG